MATFARRTFRWLVRPLCAAAVIAADEYGHQRQQLAGSGRLRYFLR